MAEVKEEPKRRKRKKIEEQKVEEPPMTSMIDIIFQLLIFFILTMKIKSVEGKLINQLPKDKGLSSSSSSSPEEQEVRIILCCVDDSQADYIREVKRHQNNKGKHEASLEVEEKANLLDTKIGKRHLAHIVVNDVCTAWVANNPVGKLYKTWVCKAGHLEEKSLSGQKRVDENAKRYKEIAKKAKELYDATPSSKDPTKRAPVILDMDSAVAYEHIIGVINALKDIGIHNIEFVANARHSKTYGSGQKGQFDNYRDQVR